MSRICIICAIRQESYPIVRHLPGAKRTLIAGIPVWECASNGNSIHVIQSGIGLAKAARAAQLAADMLHPDMVISAGFCGALSPGLETGDVITAETIRLYTSFSSDHDKTADSGPIEPLNCSGNPPILPGIFISTEHIVNKSLLAGSFRHVSGHPVILEMESWSIFNVCSERGVRFAAIRAISDPAETDPAELFRNICDKEFNISYVKLSLLLLKKPVILVQLLQLAKNANKAGRSLAEAVHYSLGRLI